MSAGDWAAVKKELLRSVDELSTDQDFQIVLFQTGRAFSMPEAWPAPVTDRYKAAAAELLGEFTPSDGSDPAIGLERAFIDGRTSCIGSRPARCRPRRQTWLRRLNVGGRLSLPPYA